ncbi:regulatory protein RecX [Yunchengibacter salinarum]|uniref:regulatory protein RecX n=1 Tax=Yunchengibacter salinarum TaxID=3133399 RepID=UPI0035B631A6
MSRDAPTDGEAGADRVRAEGAGGKPVTPAYLERAALHYLGRFMASRARLEDVLLRKVQRRTGLWEISAEHRQAVAAVVSKCAELGYVDDAAFARVRARSLLGRGKPPRQIAMDLKQKGVDEAEAQAALAALDAETEEPLPREAAVAYARRRRFGPFRRNPDVPLEPERRDRQIKSMMRAGFGPDLAIPLVDATDPDHPLPEEY